MAKRYLEKFTSIDGSSTVYTFPTARYEYQPSQSLRSPLSGIVGTDYAFRHRGFSPGLKATGREIVRAVFNDTEANIEGEIDEARSELWSIGMGKLWTLDSDSSRRWCYAELEAMPEITVSYRSRLTQPFIYVFNRLSDWFASSATSVNVTVPCCLCCCQFTVCNDGNAPVHWMEWRIRSNAACCGYCDPSITNCTNCYSFSFACVASCGANCELKVCTERATVQSSSNDGSCYCNAFACFSIPATQVGFMKLEPGANVFTPCGICCADICLSFFEAFH